ncbi:hypothetical protein MMC11_007722 [Xylographa trunciseda]|nr:hypothetical protein [Xylographa trunciseda]
MAARNKIPHIVVGIDFGMTCTGVAYSYGPDWPPPITLQHWPGKLINELANKVSTLVSYTPGTAHVKCWGFLSEAEEDFADHRELFKLDLDPRFNADNPKRALVEDARQWFQDYMRCIHNHIAETFSNNFPQWRSQRVEFIFSVPTTWKSPSLIIEIKTLLAGAGFGKDGVDHSLEIPLTEAEAAAVYASKQQFQKGDVILICDAGGGTTDVNILRLDSSPGEAAKLEQLSFVEGQSIGSTQIDMGFHNIVADRLSKIRDYLQGEPKDIADAMLLDKRFENFKCSFGSAAASANPDRYFEVPGLPPGGFNCPELGIEGSKMRLTSDELKSLFDVQVERMFKLIETQLDRLQKKEPTAIVTYLVMSGGLGSSPYIRNRLKLRYTTDMATVWPNIRGMQVVLVAEPQLVVVQGLVLNRVQEVRHGQEVFKMRCCRASYGTICRKKWDKNVHLGEDVKQDFFTNQKFAIEQIDWLIKQGDPIRGNSVRKPYHMCFSPAAPAKRWKAQMVMSDLPYEQLPTSMKWGGAEHICSLEAALAEGEMKVKNRRWYQPGPRYLRANFSVNVVIGVADLQFQLLDKDGVARGENRATVEVEWGPPRNPAAARDDMDTAMYPKG